MIQAPPRTMLEVFESLPEGTLCQLINNHLVMSPSPHFHHQDIVTEIVRQLSNYVKEQNKGKVAVAPLDVYFGKQNIYQPDIIFISAERLNIIHEGRVKGAPDLIVEVLSSSTAEYDMKDKKQVYEQFGVKEYWIVEPHSKNVSGYQLTQNIYRQISSEKGIIQSALLQLTINF